MKNITLSGVVGYTFLGFAGWIALRGAARIFMWAINPKLYPPIVFGPWELLGTVVLSAVLGLIIYKVREEGRGNGR